MEKESKDWFLLIIIFFITGVIYASFFEFHKWALFLLSFALPSFVFIFLEKIFLKKSFIAFYFLLVACFFLGIGHIQISLNQAIENENFSEQNRVIVINDPRIKKTSQSFLVKSLDNSYKFFVSASKYSFIQKYECLELKAKVKNLNSITDEGYKNYLLSKNIKGSIYRPEIIRIECPKSVKTAFLKNINDFKNKCRKVINFSLSGVKADFLGALILGDKDKIPEEWKDKLSNTGVRHILAISGMHITIWLFLIIEILILLGFWRGQAFYITILLLFFYLILIGFPASAIRASIMAIIFLTSQKLGFFTDSSRLIVMAAFFMILFNPFVIYDIGFQLSVMAVLGIIYWFPFFEELFEKIKIPNLIKSILAMTFSAQLFVMPIIAQNFNQISIISPITNLLIAPLLPFILLSGLALIVAGLIYMELVFFVNWILILMLGYIIYVVNFFDKLSFSVLNVQNFSFIIFIFYYLFLSLMTWFIIKRRKFQI